MNEDSCCLRLPSPSLILALVRGASGLWWHPSQFLGSLVAVVVLIVVWRHY